MFPVFQHKHNYFSNIKKESKEKIHFCKFLIYKMGFLVYFKILIAKRIFHLFPDFESICSFAIL